MRRYVAGRRVWEKRSNEAGNMKSPSPLKEVPPDADDEPGVVEAALEYVEEVPVEVFAEARLLGGSNGDGYKKDKAGITAERIHACEAALGYTFFDKKLIKIALTHSSSTSDKRLDNERMEFFGDAILDLVIREYLFHNYPNHQEGDLTEAKSAVVCRSSLAKASKKMDMKSYLFLGRGIGKKRGVPDSLLADAYEAIVAAIYLDGGYQPVKNFVLMTLKDEIPFAIEQANSTNYKSSLQKFLQQQKRSLPVYRVLGSTGPEHSRVFQVAALIEGEEMGRGSGSSKKAAEQEAARMALENLDTESDTAECTLHEA